MSPPGQSIGVAVKAGRVPPVVASNTNLEGKDATLAVLRRLAKDGLAFPSAGKRLAFATLCHF